MTDKIDFWTCEKDAESFSARTIDEAVLEHLDGGGAEWMLRDYHALTAYGYRQPVVDQSPEVVTQWAEELRQKVFEELDEDYSTAADREHEPDRSTDEQRAEQMAHLRAAVASILAHYEGYDCEPAGEVIVDVAAWVREHQPEWVKWLPVTDLGGVHRVEDLGISRMLCDCGRWLSAPFEATTAHRLTCRHCGRRWVGVEDGAHGHWEVQG